MDKYDRVILNEIACDTGFFEASEFAEFIERDKRAFAFFEFLPDFIQKLSCSSCILNACDEHNILWVYNHAIGYGHK